MKKLILILTIIFACSLCVCAHPGSLDENGGHWDHSTGEYHYHDGTNQGNNSSGTTSVIPSEPVKELTIFSTCYIPLWLVLSLFCISHYFQLNINDYGSSKGCLLSLLIIPYLAPPVFFATIISDIILGHFDELIVGVVSIAVFGIFSKLNHTVNITIVSGLVAVISAISPWLFVGNTTESTCIALWLIVIYVIYITSFTIFKNYKQSKKASNNKYNSKFTYSKISEQPIKASNPPTHSFNNHSTEIHTNKASNDNKELEKLLIEHWEQRQAAKVKPKPIYSSLPVSKPTVDDDEAQRLDSLLLYVDELEEARNKYKNNKKK